MSLDRIQGLRKSLHDHNFRYYVSDNPIISDFEFDKLLEELYDLNEDTNEKSKKSRVLQSKSKNKIRTLNGLFSGTTSHDSLRSILQALKQPTRSSK